MVQPVAQQTRAHAGGGGVEHRQQGWRRFAAQGFGEFQIAPGGGVKLHVVAVALGADGLDVRQCGALGGLDVVEQGACGGNRQAQIGDAEAGEIAAAELLCQPGLRPARIELPRRQPANRAMGAVEGKVVGCEDFRRPHPRQQGGQGGGMDLGDLKAPGCEIEPGYPDHFGALRASVRRCINHAGGDGENQRVARFVQQPGIGQRAGRDDARDLPVDRTFGGGRIAHLLGDDHRLAQLQQPRQVLLGAVVRHAGHLDRAACRGAARGERDVEQPRSLFGVVEKQLVKIAHAVEQQHVGMLRLDAQILLHHRRGGSGLLGDGHGGAGVWVRPSVRAAGGGQ